MTTPDPTYITVAEVRASTLISGLQNVGTIDDADLTLLIQTAEDSIDEYVGRQKHHPLDTNVNRVFPRDQDYERTNLVEYPNTPEVPYLVSKACLRQVEWLYTQWFPNATTQELPTQQDLSSLDVGGDGSIREVYAGNGKDFSGATLSPNAKALLKDFTGKFSSISTSSLSSPNILSSRE